MKMAAKGENHPCAKLTEWITNLEAGKIMGCSPPTSLARAHQNGWEIKPALRTPPSYGPPLFTYRRSVVEEYAAAHPKRDMFKRIKTQSGSTETQKIVDWADGLTVWPSDEEIEAHTSPDYPFANVVSVLESRSRRDKGFEWEGRGDEA